MQQTIDLQQRITGQRDDGTIDREIPLLHQGVELRLEAFAWIDAKLVSEI